MVRLWLDDERPAPAGWVRAQSSDQALHVLQTAAVEEVSLDHDLGGEDTGYRVLLWIEEKVFLDPAYRPPKVRIHSANTSARVKMELAVSAIERQLQTRRENEG